MSEKTNSLSNAKSLKISPTYYLDKIQNIISDNNKIDYIEFANKIATYLSDYNQTIHNNISNDYLKIFYEKINEYNKDYDSIVLNSLKKIENLKYQEYIFLSTSILKDNYEKIEKIKNIFDYKNITYSNIEEKNIEEKNLTSQIEAVPKYLCYAYSNTSNVTLSEAYEKSLIKSISDLGLDIINSFVNINKLYYAANKKNIYADNCNDFGIISVNIRDIADSELKFKNLISMLYKGIYEFTNSHNNNIFYELAKKFKVDSIGLDLIKWYRALDEHSTDKTDEKKINNIYEFNLSVINKKIPEKPSDYVKLQHALYEKLYNMLSSILKNLNL